MAATHIGRPEDAPARTLIALREANLLIFEEDRPARQLLKLAGVHREYLRYNEHHSGHHKESGRSAKAPESLVMTELRRVLREGGTACYASDQGTPGLADPGRGLVELAFEVGARLEIIPGPSSVTAAIAACPFSCDAFHYAGFLPRKGEDRERALRRLANLPTPFIVMDTPYRLQALLEDAAGVLPDRKALLSLDISGPDEDYWFAPLGTLARKAGGLPGKRNFVLVVEGP